MFNGHLLKCINYILKMKKTHYIYCAFKLKKKICNLKYKWINNNWNWKF